jgi:hypothetical protein
MIAAHATHTNISTPAHRSLFAMAVALGVGASALIAPPVAVLGIAALGARAIMSGATVRLDVRLLLAPLALGLAIGAMFGLAAGVGMFFACRLFVDARWSVNEAERLARESGRPQDATIASTLHAWLTPAYGLALVAYTAPHMIAGLPLDLPHAPALVPIVAGGLAVGALFDWALRRTADWRLGELCQSQTAHLLAHHIVFVAAFGLTLDVSGGIVALIAWRLAHAAR